LVITSHFCLNCCADRDASDVIHLKVAPTSFLSTAKRKRLRFTDFIFFLDIFFVRKRVFCGKNKNACGFFQLKIVASVENVNYEDNFHENPFLVVDKSYF